MDCELAMSDPKNRGLKTTFDQDAENYDRARPLYPEAVFDDLARMTGLGAGSSVLEIGCGTGQATGALAKRGYRITCVELGENLAEVARRNLAEYPDVRVENAAFEEWDAGGERFDLVFGAQSWHWLDPEFRYLKAAEILKPGGRLAVLDVEHAFPKDTDPFFFEIQKAYDEITVEKPSHHVWPPPLPEEVPDMREEFEASGRFEEFQSTRYVWDVMYTTDEYIALLNTFSNHIASEPWQLEHLFARVRELIGARPEGRVRRHWLAILNVAKLSAPRPATPSG
jgi:SAM-dependent methyltransferase